MSKNTLSTKKEINGITYYERGIIDVDGNAFLRFAIKTHFIKRKESYLEIIGKYVMPICKSGDILSISEKVISMCQDNCVERKDIKLGLWAKFLSKFALRTSAGIGMDEPHKLQLTINIVGLPKVLFAAVLSGLGKIIGKRGIFYKIVGNGVAGIDGLYPNSSFEIYKDMAVLNPIDADSVCDEIKKLTNLTTYIVDANDIAQEILGKCSDSEYTDETFLKMIKDNPAGQSDELTPFIIIRKG
ncbi:MAG: coenzyme F420-0:L-glutamate ligase [Anaerorhabdus sp.]